MSAVLAAYLALFVVLLLFGMPVAWSMATATVGYIAFSGQWSLLPILPEKLFQGMDVFILVAIPMFLLAGEIFNQGGIAQRLIDLSDKLVGWLTGGLGQVAIAASIFFAGITGVALGEIAALGRIFIPAMTKAGYPAPLAAAIVASASIIGPTIPPSLPIIVYGSVTNVSIGGMFAAAVVPGVLLGLVQMALVWFIARRLGIKPEPADRSLPAIGRAGSRAALAIGMPVIILGSILGGLMTPTEAAGMSAAYALVVGLVVYRSLKLAQLPEILRGSVAFSGQLIIIVACGAAFGWVMGFENVTGRLATEVASWNLGPVGTMLLANILLLILGMFIDPSASIILFAPILAPAAAAVGIDPLHFGVVVILNLNIGLLTPPLGVSLFAVERIAGCGLTPVIRAALPFIAVNLVALLLVSAVPWLSLALPRLAGF
jgi:tripartite ATP-independent transporter DctM subunit